MSSSARGVGVPVVVLLLLPVLHSCRSADTWASVSEENENVSTQPTNARIVEQLLANRSGLAVCWLGNDGWLIRGQGRLIAFDLDLLESDLRLGKPPVSAEDLAPVLDAVFITHEHGDHFRDATATALARKSECLFVLPANCLRKARRLGIPDERIVVARPRQPLDVLGLHVVPIRAIHGRRHQAVHRNANLDDCGYVITVAGHTLLQPGDSVLTQDHLELKDVDIVFVSPTDHNLAIGPASILLSTLRPSWIFPQHFDTYKTTAQNDFWTVGHPDELRAALAPEVRSRFHTLRQGQVFVIEPR